MVSTVDINEVGGMENIKSWLTKRANIFSKEAQDFGLSAPKGVLMTGISGCGKSLFVKAISSFWGLPLIRLDMSKVYEGTFGSPEECLRKAINSAETISPCIMDRRDRGRGLCSGLQGRGRRGVKDIRHIPYMDAGKEQLCLCCCNCKCDSTPPAELLRKGRFDEIFYVSLPNIMEREQIFKIHLEKRKNDTTNFDLDLLAHSTKGLQRRRD